MNIEYLDCKDTLHQTLFEKYGKCIPDKLYFIGNIDLLNENVIALIGKRESNFQKEAFNYGREVANSGNILLNGLAIGCDAYGIKGCLSEGGKVIAVLPSGLNNVYPKCHIDLVNEIIINGGCILSAYSPSFIPAKYTFIERDKLQAAFANKVFVIDAEETGGTMHTVRFAKQFNKPIGCLVDNNTSSGNRFMVDKLGAYPIKNFSDFNEFINQPEYHQLRFIF